MQHEPIDFDTDSDFDFDFDWTNTAPGGQKNPFVTDGPWMRSKEGVHEDLRICSFFY